jgi:hypothetical protein
MARKATAQINADLVRTKNKDGTLRKRRTDRNHIVYMITCNATGDNYIGVTRALGRAYQHSIVERLRKHCRDAILEGRKELIHDCIRSQISNPNDWKDKFKTEILYILRGKESGHQKEIELIKERRPSLNIEGTERKSRRNTQSVEKV